MKMSTVDFNILNNFCIPNIEIELPSLNFPYISSPLASTTRLVEKLIHFFKMRLIKYLSFYFSCNTWVESIFVLQFFLNIQKILQ